jgi:hypothetical protein
MHTLTTAVILPATRQLNVTAFTADGTGIVLVHMPAPEPGTTGITFMLIPNEDVGDIVVEAPLFRVAPARQAALSVYFATIASRRKGVTWMIHDGMAYASVHVDLTGGGDAPALVAAAFDRLAYALGETYAEITRIAVGAPRRRSRAERQVAAVVAAFDDGESGINASAAD